MMIEPEPRELWPRDWPTLTKGHGTGNDFLLLTDPEAALSFGSEEIAAVADRRFGIGADGVIRAVRTESLRAADASVDALLRAAGRTGEEAPEWFMDYRNADGSIAEMCGNGLRVFIRYLLESGLTALRPGEGLVVGTRAGVLTATLLGDGAEIAVDMGRFGIPGGAEALARGSDATVEVAGLAGARPGLSVTMPNPHVVIDVAEVSELHALDLTRAPVVEPLPAGGTNVEIVHVTGEYDDAESVGTLIMRVHERGVGETLSCGTGACAAAVAARAWAGPGAPSRWIVHVPGGTLRVTIGAEDSVRLAGPAVLVGRVTLR